MGHLSAADINKYIEIRQSKLTCCGCNNPTGEPVGMVGCQKCGLEYPLCEDCIDDDECPFDAHVNEEARMMFSQMVQREIDEALRDTLAHLRLGNLSEWDE